MTLIERHNGHYFGEVDSFRGALCVKVVEDIPKLSATEM